MIKPLRFIKSALWAVLVFCIGLRVMAWLVAPAVPLIAVFFLLFAALVFVLTSLFGP